MDEKTAEILAKDSADLTNEFLKLNGPDRICPESFLFNHKINKEQAKTRLYVSLSEPTLVMVKLQSMQDLSEIDAIHQAITFMLLRKGVCNV